MAWWRDGLCSLPSTCGAIPRIAACCAVGRGGVAVVDRCGAVAGMVVLGWGAAMERDGEWLAAVAGWWRGMGQLGVGPASRQLALGRWCLVVGARRCRRCRAAVAVRAGALGLAKRHGVVLASCGWPLAPWACAAAPCALVLGGLATCGIFGSHRFPRSG